MVPPRPPPGLYTAVGPGSLPSWFLSALTPALGTPGPPALFWIDAGNGFDAYGGAGAARAAGGDPRRALARIRLARPFNVFQLETMVSRKLPQLWRGEPVVLSDPLGPFHDADLPDEDARKVLPRVLEGMARLPAVWMVLAVLRQELPGRGGVLKAFLKESRRTVLLGPEGRLRRLE